MIISYIVYVLFGAESGMINNSILMPGRGYTHLLVIPRQSDWPVILTCVYLWKSFGYSSIVYFATLSALTEPS